MDSITAVTVVIGITAFLNWISLRWLKTTTIGVPAITAIVAVALVSGGNQLTVLVLGVLLFVAFLTSRYFGLAGPLEALASGLAFRLFAHHRQNHDFQDASPEFWDAIADMENSVLFVLLGLWITANGINATAITVGTATVLVILLVRFASTRDVLLRLVRKSPWNSPSALLSVLGSYKGGIPIALAFAVPYSGTRSWLLSATFIVASISTVVQGGMMGWISRLGTPKAGHPHLARN